MTREAPPRGDGPDRVGRVESLISTVLRVGVLVSLALIVAGMALSFTHHPRYTISAADLQRLTRPGAAFPHHLKDVAVGLEQFRGQAVATLGILVLIATPVVRVAVSVLAFVAERDRVFVGFTLLVFLLLLASFALGAGGG